MPEKTPAVLATVHPDDASMHAVRLHGDCLPNHPRISVATLTPHAHDIFPPDTLSPDQIRDQRIFRTEQRLMYARVCQKPTTRAIHGSRYHARPDPDVLEQCMHGRYRVCEASFRFEQERTL